MMNVIHKLKRRIQKKYINLIRLTQSRNNIVSAYEIDCISICKKLINKNETILMSAPISNKKFIKNEENEITIILDSYNVQVINHIYSYNVYLSEKSWDYIISYFNNEIEKRREEFEKEITSNIKHSLQNILIKL